MRRNDIYASIRAEETTGTALGTAASFLSTPSRSGAPDAAEDVVVVALVLVAVVVALVLVTGSRAAHREPTDIARGEEIHLRRSAHAVVDNMAHLPATASPGLVHTHTTDRKIQSFSPKIQSQYEGRHQGRAASLPCRIQEFVTKYLSAPL